MTESTHEALQNNLPLQHVYFGIDVWAQNATKLSQPRVTYPEYGGGGTNTGIAVAKLAKSGLSAGIFAPAWTFEHFPCHGREVEQTVWDGQDLPKDVACSCGDCEKRHRPNRTMPVTCFAKLSNSGSETFFFTDFTKAFGTHSEKEKDTLFGGYTLHAQLGSQSILPLSPESFGIQYSMRHRTEYAEGRSKLVVESCGLHVASSEKDAAFTNCSQSMPLFTFNMPADGSLRLRISYRDFTKPSRHVYFYMKISGTMHSLVQSGRSRIGQLVVTEIKANDTVSQPNPRLQEIGLFSLTGDAGVCTKLVEVDYICIQPVGSYPSWSQADSLEGDISRPGPSLDTTSVAPQQPHSIFNVHKESHSGGVTQCTRLCWSHSSGVCPAEGMPYSASTGSFAYFAIYLDDMFLGRAYAAQHELPTSFAEQSAGREVVVNIKGVGFDGRELASTRRKIQF